MAKLNGSSSSTGGFSRRGVGFLTQWRVGNWWVSIGLANIGNCYCVHTARIDEGTSFTQLT